MMNKETLSALLDDQLEPDRLEAAIEQLLNDPELQLSWRRQHLLRAAIADQQLVGPVDMADRISAAVAREPTIIAPDNLAAADPARGASIVAHEPSHRGSRKRYVAYAAVAASLLVVVLTRLPQPTPDAVPIADRQETSPATQAAEQELQAMIVQHGEFSGAAALNGLVAYTKVVTGAAPAAGPSRP